MQFLGCKFGLKGLTYTQENTVNPRLAETGILKSETETEKFSDLIEKHKLYVTDKTQNLRLHDPLLGLCKIFRDLGRIC